MRSNDEDHDDEFELVTDSHDKPEKNSDSFMGFHMVPESKSQIMPAKKGYIQTLKDELKVKVTNFYYKLQQASTPIRELAIPKDDCFFLGKPVQSTEQLAKWHSELMYFSYREFNEPIHYQSKKLFNDTCRLQ